jgi:hypothetical protein
MTTNNEEPKPADNMELLKQQASCCGGDCSCHAPKAPGKLRWVVGALVLLIAGALLVHAVIKSNAPGSAKAAACCCGTNSCK